jgi:hypothetical protein
MLLLSVILLVLLESAFASKSTISLKLSQSETANHMQYITQSLVVGAHGQTWCNSVFSFANNFDLTSLGSFIKFPNYDPTGRSSYVGFSANEARGVGFDMGYSQWYDRLIHSFFSCCSYPIGMY